MNTSMWLGCVFRMIAHHVRHYYVKTYQNLTPTLRSYYVNTASPDESESFTMLHLLKLKNVSLVNAFIRSSPPKRLFVCLLLNLFLLDLSRELSTRASLSHIDNRCWNRCPA